MASRMPILGQGHMVEAFDEAIDDRHHAISVGDRKRSAGAKIILHVDNQQQIIVWKDLHFITPAGGVCRTLAQNGPLAEWNH